MRGGMRVCVGEEAVRDAGGEEIAQQLRESTAGRKLLHALHMRRVPPSVLGAEAGGGGTCVRLRRRQIRTVVLPPLKPPHYDTTMVSPLVLPSRH